MATFTVEMEEKTLRTYLVTTQNDVEDFFSVEAGVVDWDLTDETVIYSEVLEWVKEDGEPLPW